jgi:protein O-GlcNAc transferase
MPLTALLESGSRFVIEEAISLHQKGRLVEAASLYRKILAENPEHADALNLLGVIEIQRKNASAGIELINRAITIDPNNAVFFSNRGAALRDLKRLDDALVSYDRALAIKPSYADALNNRGVVLRELKRFAEALASFDRALAMKSDYVEAFNNRGNALRDLKRFDEALASYDRALTIKPDYAEALYNRGNTLRELRRFDDALTSFDGALAIKHNYVEALYSRGIALRELKRFDDALASYERALTIKPDHAQAFNNRGNVLQDLQRFDDALASYDRALAIKPDYAEAFHNRGVALRELNRFADALASLDCALAIEPDYAEALYNRGNALRDLKRFDDALASYDRVLAIKPDHAEAFNNRGVALQELRRFDDALASYDRALAIKPDYAEIFHNRGVAFSLLGRFEEAANDYKKALTINPDAPYARGHLAYWRISCCDWRSLEEDRREIAAGLRAGKRVIQPGENVALSASPEDQLSCARIWVTKECRPAAEPIPRGNPYRHERLRIAYLSADFWDHVVAAQLVGVLEHHDTEHFDVTGISFGHHDEDAMRTRLRRAFPRFVDVQNTSEGDVAALLRQAEIDIAIDLMGFTTHCRSGIYALRPAPLQVSFLGFPGTMGSTFIDYLIADETVIPAEHQRYYAEKIAYLPDTYMPTDRTRITAGHTATRSDEGLPEAAFVFCSFCNHYKFMPEIFDIWMRLLRRVEGSVLWLRAGNASAMSNLRLAAEARGVTPNRLVFAPFVANASKHIARLRLADLFLDTAPYNAHATASDSLMAGVPVLTLLGESFAGRVGASLLNAGGMPELVTLSAESYEARAFELAHNPGALASLKAKLIQNAANGPLFDTIRYTRNLEAAYGEMWRLHERGETPRNFMV